MQGLKPQVMLMTGVAMMAASLLGACATPKESAGPPTLTAPWTGILATTEAVPMPTEPEVWVARGERTVAGSLPLLEYSAFSIYTYDTQRIGGRGEGSYRYRRVIQAGINVP